MNNSSSFDVEAIRKEFPMMQKHIQGKPLIYLDSAATTQKPRAVIETLLRFYAEEYGTVHRAVYELASHATARYDAVRESLKKFLGAAYSEEIVFTKGTTEAINLVASSFGKAFVNKGDEILISESEHHSNIVPWQLLCEERGAVLKIIPINDKGEILIDELDNLLTSKTKLVSIAHIANSTGTIHPIEQIIKKAHAKGAKVLIDGAQSAAHMPVDVQALDADFFVFSGHKTYGPTGIGVLYGKKELLNQMPPYQAGGDMIEKVSFQGTTYQPTPLRFEAGTPMIAEVIGLGAAIDYIESLGRSNIAAWEQKLLHYATQQLLAIPSLHIMGKAASKAAIISFTVDGVHSLDIGTLLDLQGIAVRTGHLCAQPTLQHFGYTSVTRISFGVYNTIQEIDLFIAALKETLLRLRPSLSY